MPATTKSSDTALTIDDLFSNRRLPGTRIYNIDEFDATSCKPTVATCATVVKLYKEACERPLTEQQRRRAQQQLLRTGGSLWLIVEHLQSVRSRKVLATANQVLSDITKLLDITLQHLQQEAAGIES